MLPPAAILILLHTLSYATAQGPALTLIVSGGDLQVLNFGGNNIVPSTDLPPINQSGSWITLNREGSRLFQSDEEPPQLLVYSTNGGNLTQEAKSPITGAIPVHSGLIQDEAFILTAS
jgi:hypothetical protein